LDAAAAAERGELKPGPYVLLSVRDSGCGMTDEVREHLFEPFFTTKGPGKGTGLGLAMVYGVVKQSGGHVEVFSKPGQGTTFTLFLPQLEDMPTDSNAGRQALTQAGGKETILLVEDEEGVRKLAQRALKAQGYTVLAAGDGEAAETLLASHLG